jgi:hypothetical protein
MGINLNYKRKYVSDLSRYQHYGTINPYRQQGMLFLFHELDVDEMPDVIGNTRLIKENIKNSFHDWPDRERYGRYFFFLSYSL